MLNIEQPLELTGDLSGYEPRNPRMDGPYLRVDLHYKANGAYYSSAHFDPLTGIYSGYEGMDNPSVRLRPLSATRPVDHFYLWAGKRDWAKPEWVKLNQEHFLNGAEAATRMKALNGQDSPFRFMVKKEVELSPVRDYESWAAFRVETKEWIMAPWTNEPWCKHDHFAHHSVSDDSQIAFWPNEAEAQNDRVTVMKPGRYLQEYYGDVLSNEEIRDWAVRVDAEAELRFARTPDEIYDVYTAPNAPHSCMVYKDNEACHGGSKWSSGINPTRIYGAGDLAIAYLERRGKIIARCLVWPERKVAQRVYGDIERLVERLKAEGYRFDADRHSAHSSNNGLFNGARLLRIEPEGHPDHVVMPYLDFGYRANRVDEEYLEMNVNGAIPGDNTCGISSTRREFCCRDCDDYYDYEADGHDLNGYTYCTDCYHGRTTSCDGCGDWVADGTIYFVADSNLCPTCYDTTTTTCDYCCDRVVNAQTSVVSDARSGAHYADACDDCVDGAGTIQRDQDDNLIDMSTATHCESCDIWFGNDLEACPRVHAPELETA